MIRTKDQEELFRLIAEYLDEDIRCVAIGGTAMMFEHYKTATKDIDLVFRSESDRTTFIKAIEELGYKEIAIGDVYDAKRKYHSNKPRLYTRGDERFDLFIKNVFGYDIEFNQERAMRRNDFLGQKELTLLLFPVEELILLKVITGRLKDHEDIEMVLEIEKTVDWNLIVQKAIKQKKNNDWILINLEETLQKLRKRFFIKQEIFETIYDAQAHR